MFNRVFQVKVVKEDTAATSSEPETKTVPFDFNLSTTKVVNEGLRVMAAYMLLDTLRKVMVVMAEK